MPEIGPMELLVVAMVALIVFGPEKLPDMARKAGSFIADMRRMATEVRSEFHELDADDDDDDDSFDPQDEKATPASLEDEADLESHEPAEAPIVHKTTRRAEPDET